MGTNNNTLLRRVFSVTTPDGVTHTRTSKSRVYTHAGVYQRTTGEMAGTWRVVGYSSSHEGAMRLEKAVTHALSVEVEEVHRKGTGPSSEALEKAAATRKVKNIENTLRWYRNALDGLGSNPEDWIERAFRRPGYAGHRTDVELRQQHADGIAKYTSEIAALEKRLEEAKAARAALDAPVAPHGWDSVDGGVVVGVDPATDGAERTVYRLQSSPMICAPGVLRLIQAAYRSGDKAWALRAMSTWEGIPADVAEKLAAGTLPYTVDANESVVVEV